MRGSVLGFRVASRSGPPCICVGYVAEPDRASGPSGWGGTLSHRRKTAPGRLAGLDQLLRAWDPALFEPEAFGGLPIVDLGIGATAVTTVELAEAVAPIPVVGLDVVPEVVERAQALAQPGLVFREGSFDTGIPSRLVRVMNVLRDLEPAQVDAVHRRIGRAVCEDGLVVEGSSGTRGEAGVAHALRRDPDGLRRQALLFWADGSRGTAPRVFLGRLPRDLADDHPVHLLIDRWMRAWSDLPAGPHRLAGAARTVPDLTAVGPGFVWAPADGVP